MTNAQAVLVIAVLSWLFSAGCLWHSLHVRRTIERERQEHGRAMTIRAQQLQSYEGHLARIRYAVEGEDTGAEPSDPWLRGYRACAEAVLKEINGSRQGVST